MTRSPAVGGLPSDSATLHPEPARLQHDAVELSQMSPHAIALPQLSWTADAGEQVRRSATHS
jgi:hypothetical protein